MQGQCESRAQVHQCPFVLHGALMTLSCYKDTHSQGFVILKPGFTSPDRHHPREGRTGEGGKWPTVVPNIPPKCEGNPLTRMKTRD